MTWEEYCLKKKINSEAFKKNNPDEWWHYKTLFEQIHPNSFTEQKKFLINQWRRLYKLST